MIEGGTLNEEMIDEAAEARELSEYEQAKNLEAYVEEIKAVRQTLTYSEIDNRMGQEYQRCFTEAMNETDPMKRAYALERMKGVAMARGIIDQLQKELESEIAYLLEEAQE